MVVAGVVLVAGLTVVVYEQSQMFRRQLAQDFHVLRSLSDASAKLARIHIDVQRLLEDAGQAFDEEAVYTRGSAAFKAIDDLIGDLQHVLHLEPALPLHSDHETEYRATESVLELVHGYRATLVSSIEMTSVDLTRARAELARAAGRFNLTTVAFTNLIGHFQNDLDHNFQHAIVDARRAFLWWGGPAGAVVAVVLLLSWLMARGQSRDLGRLLASMRRLGAGDTDADIPDLKGDKDLAPIVGALGVFRGALVELKRSQAILEEKVRERTHELEKAVAELEQEVAQRIASEGNLNVVLESMDQGIYAVGPDLRVTLINSRFNELYGLPPEMRRPGFKYEDLARFNAEHGRFGSGDQEEQVEERMKLARENRPFRFEIALADGRTADTRSNPLPGGGFVRTATDITERKEMEARLRQAQKMQSLGNLAGGLAHEINNLLLPILALAKMTLKQFPADSRDATRMQKIIEASERAKALVAQVMAFGRQDEPRMELIALHRVIRETMELIYKTLLSTITVRQHLDENTGTVWADAAQVGAVLMNLVSNAQDAFDGKTGEIDVSLGPVEVDAGLAKSVANLKPGPHARLSVSDKGKGMDEETLDRVFDPFFTTKEVGDGKGLGLSMVHGIIDKHGGAIHLVSKPDAGTTVDVYLPLVEKDAARNESPGKNQTKAVPVG